ncbi:MAG: RDD family protein [Methylococcales bacterium]|nr:RDD family protein [Methylococcales bacterium]
MDSPGFFRHLAIIIYDALLLLAVLFLATAIALPFNNGEAFTNTEYLFPLYLLTISFLFYGWFWTHGGQTLGMKTWKVRIQTLDNQPLTWTDALKRFLLAIISWGLIGLGFLWKLIDKKNYTWHDHLSKTTLFFVENASSD